MIAVGIVDISELCILCMHEWLMNGQLNAVWASEVNASGIRRVGE